MANKRMIALKNFEGAEREGFIRRGQAFDTSQNAAQGYVANGLAKEMPGPPSKEDAERATASDAEQKAAAKEAAAAKKAAEPEETKESGRHGVVARPGGNKGR